MEKFRQNIHMGKTRILRRVKKYIQLNGPGKGATVAIPFDVTLVLLQLHDHGDVYTDT
jgi:hypothetical protein